MPWTVSGLFISSGLTQLPSFAYTGPGDIISGATAWWGLRAYSAAKIGSSCIRLRRDSDNTEQDFVTLANGGVDTASITTFKGAANLFVTKIYDQTANAQHLAQTTAALQPKFTLSGIGTLPVMTFVFADGRNLELTTGFSPATQPYTLSVVMNDADANGATYTTVLANGSADSVGMFGDDGTSQRIEIGAGAGAFIVGMDANVWHAVQGIFNGASSNINFDSTDHTGTVGTTAWGSAASLGGNRGGHSFDGMITEAGMWPIAFSAGNNTDMALNQRTYWGF